MTTDITADSKEPAPTGIWLTTADQAALLQRQTSGLEFLDDANPGPRIRVDAAQTYQTIEGFGFALTGGSAYLISQLEPSTRAALLRELFSPDGDGIGVSYLRISIGASDLSTEAYSYDEMPAGQTDADLAGFDLFAGDKEVVPVLQEILAINPALKLLGAPWSAPRWMKTHASFIGGNLKPEWQDVYARYFVRYVQTMATHGIRIHAITPQNEPLHGGNEPSMVMDAAQQADFIKNHLGPALRTAGLDTEIFCWDHNCDMPEYPLHILQDAQARDYVAGSAWHLYGGDIGVLSAIHKAHPDKRIYFTEQWVGRNERFGDSLAWHGRQVLIGALRNWSSVVLEWNLASDPNTQPHTPGGCSECLGAVTIGDGVVRRNVAYYVIGHAAKFVGPGSVRIASSQTDELCSVAFKTPAGNIVAIVLNVGNTEQTFGLEFAGRTASAMLPAGALGTYVW